MRDAYDTGRRVIEAFDRGRAIAIEQNQQRAAPLRAAVKRLAEDDMARGRPRRGRAGRIVRQLRGLKVSERRVLQILSELQSCVSDSA
jgi:hypothetical protein